MNVFYLFILIIISFNKMDKKLEKYLVDLNTRMRKDIITLDSIDFVKNQELWKLELSRFNQKYIEELNFLSGKLIDLFKSSTFNEIEDIRLFLKNLSEVRNGILIPSSITKNNGAKKYLENNLLKIIIANPEDLREVAMGLDEDVKYAKENNIDYKPIFKELSALADDKVYEWNEDIGSMKDLFLLYSEE